MAWLLEEPAAERIDVMLSQAQAGRLLLSMSWINAGECYYMLMRKQSRRAAADFLNRLPTLPIRLVLPDSDDVMEAASLKATRKMSYADAFAVALARRENASLVTGDPELRHIPDIHVEWIGAE